MAAEADERVRRLIESATQERASGRPHEAARALEQAALEAPNHPLVLNEVARQRLQAGDPAGAHALLEQALTAEPADPSLWLNLSAAASALGRRDAERAALDKALDLQPGNLQALLRMAALLAADGDSRASAATYRTALQTIPAGAKLSPDMQRILQAARATIDANNIDLENFLDVRLKDLRARHSDEPLGRFDKALATLLLQRRVYRPQPSFLYFPHLPAIEFHDREDFPWLGSIEAATEDIRTELQSVLAMREQMLQPYVALPRTMADQWRDLNNSLRWGAYFFWREGSPFAENMARCPRTMAALEAWPPCEIPNCAPTAMFSILEAQTRIPPHTGVNNCRLVVHLPLVVPRGCGFRVGAETRGWELGSAFVFDDTIEHEAWNDSDDWRAVLILDIWNPALSLAERELVCALTAGVDEFYGDLPEYVRPLRKAN